MSWVQGRRGGTAASWEWEVEVGGALHITQFSGSFRRVESLSSPPRAHTSLERLRSCHLQILRQRKQKVRPTLYLRV